MGGTATRWGRSEVLRENTLHDKHRVMSRDSIRQVDDRNVNLGNNRPDLNRSAANHAVHHVLGDGAHERRPRDANLVMYVPLKSAAGCSHGVAVDEEVEVRGVRREFKGRDARAGGEYARRLSSRRADRPDLHRTHDAPATERAP